jgi:hypothetical protein
LVIDVYLGGRERDGVFRTVGQVVKNLPGGARQGCRDFFGVPPEHNFRIVGWDCRSGADEFCNNRE